MDFSLKLTLENIFGHEYFLAIYGVVIYYGIVLDIERRAFKQKHPKTDFSFKRWRMDNITSFLVTALIAPLVIIFDDEIIGVYNSFAENDIEMSKLIYLCAGPITAIVTRLVTKYKGQLENGG